jgi:hypothetical protein
MNRAALVMAGVAAASALGGGLLVTRPSRTPQMVYVKRIGGMMAFALALFLGLFAYGLTVIGT